VQPERGAVSTVSSQQGGSVSTQGKMTAARVWKVSRKKVFISWRHCHLCLLRDIRGRRGMLSYRPGGTQTENSGALQIGRGPWPGLTRAAH
jgi:hypothetical protein